MFSFVASLLQYTLTDLVSLCEGFLQGVLDEENACHLYHYADALGMPTFEHRVLTFMIRNWWKISRYSVKAHMCAVGVSALLNVFCLFNGFGSW